MLFGELIHLVTYPVLITVLPLLAAYVGLELPGIVYVVLGIGITVIMLKIKRQEELWGSFIFHTVALLVAGAIAFFAKTSLNETSFVLYALATYIYHEIGTSGMDEWQMVSARIYSIYPLIVGLGYNSLIVGNFPFLSPWYGAGLAVAITAALNMKFKRWRGFALHTVVLVLGMNLSLMTHVVHLGVVTFIAFTIAVLIEYELDERSPTVAGPYGLTMKDRN